MGIKVGAVHATINSVQPLQHAFRQLEPAAELFHFVNDHLLFKVKQKGKVEQEDIVDFTRLIFHAVDAKVDGIIVVGTVFCPHVPLFANLVQVPIIAINQPMIKKAVTIGERIGVVATTAPTGPATEKQLQDYAQKINKKIEIEVAIVTEALDELNRGNGKRHDEIIQKAASDLQEKGCDPIILAQISMARAANSLNIDATVLTSPEEGVREIMRQIKNIRMETKKN